jgi:hypothetical protein
VQIQNKEVSLRDSTVAAQLLAQGERAHAAKAAKAAKAAVDQAKVQAQAVVAQAQAQAQAAVAQAQILADKAADAVTLVKIKSQTQARAVESIEARSRISLESRRLEIQAARNLDHAILDDEEAEEGGRFITWVAMARIGGSGIHVQGRCFPQSGRRSEE